MPGNSSNGDFWLGYNAATGNSLTGQGATAHLVVTTGGKVGIGTTSPAGLLELEAASPSIILDKSEKTFQKWMKIGMK